MKFLLETSPPHLQQRHLQRWGTTRTVCPVLFFCSVECLYKYQTQQHADTEEEESEGSVNASQSSTGTLPYSPCSAPTPNAAPSESYVLEEEGVDTSGIPRNVGRQAGKSKVWDHIRYRRHRSGRSGASCSDTTIGQWLRLRHSSFVYLS
ncbi:hypothetical protein PHYPSEUDO_008200 [Phytophthora pseudosyringae]|uniref:Uncharacterized protein n=1 Tax=Phytophthora pseudosyringae TaxID=221518 RepID=A0A8T1W8R6_9STRA|nr:hypothetical protein PHYPSEUDO_008200 [Phytophthora pseudosyringae]